MSFIAETAFLAFLSWLSFLIDFFFTAVLEERLGRLSMAQQAAGSRRGFFVPKQA
jgi:hypothetical protein